MLEENQIKINANFTVDTTTEKLTGVLSVFVLPGVNVRGPSLINIKTNGHWVHKTGVKIVSPQE